MRFLNIALIILLLVLCVAYGLLTYFRSYESRAGFCFENCAYEVCHGVSLPHPMNPIEMSVLDGGWSRVCVGSIEKRTYDMQRPPIPAHND